MTCLQSTLGSTFVGASLMESSKVATFTMVSSTLVGKHTVGRMVAIMIEQYPFTRIPGMGT